MNAAPSAAARSRAAYLGLTIFAALLWFAVLPQRPLFNPDEGRYAEIAREMLASGEWIVPHLNGLAYVEKPPLQYWATAAALRLFGNTEFAARLYTALCAWGTLCVVAFGATRCWGSEAAWRAAAVLASMSLFVVLGQLLTLDMSLTFYMTLSLVAFLLAQRAAEAAAAVSAAQAAAGAATVHGWMLVAWGAAALGVMTKGPVAAAIPGAVLVLYSLYTRDYTPWRRLHARWGVPLFLLLAAPWFGLAARRLPGFLEFFFVHEHLSRYLTPSAHREQPWWFFGAVLALGSLPWTLSAVRVAVRGGRRRRAPGFDPAVFLWIWALFVAVFFSLSDSKLIPYVLPALPALALLIGASAPATLRRELLIAAALTLLGAAVLGVLARFGARWVAPGERTAHFLLLARPFGQVAALLGVSGVFSLVRRRGSVGTATLVLGAGWCLAGLLLMRAAALVAPLYSGVTLAQALPNPDPALPIYSVGTYDQTLPFYWQRTVTLAAYRGELDYGLTHDPAAALGSVDEFVERWRGSRAGYAVMERGLARQLAQRAVPMREIAHAGNRVLVAR